jgi:hypothetical protein
MRADAGCCVLLRATAQEPLRKSEGPTPRCTNITVVIFPLISKTAMCKPANEERLKSPTNQLVCVGLMESRCFLVSTN